MLPSYKLFKFADFTLNSLRRNLLQGDKEIRLNDKDFDVLLFLIENAPRFCSIDEIIETVWNGTNVNNNSVEKIIANIRKVLGDDKTTPLFIRTGRGKGYSFICDVYQVEAKTSAINHNNFENLAQAEKHNFLGSGRNKKGVYYKLIFFCFIVVLLSGFFWLIGANPLERFNKTTIFADDFSDNKIDTSQWETLGKSVNIAEGSLKLSVDETDNPGMLYSKYFTVDPSKTIKVKSRMKVSFSQNMKNETYFGGIFGFIPKTERLENLPAHQDYDAENLQYFGVRYMNYDSQLKFQDFSGETMQEVPTEGFYIVKAGGRPNAKSEFEAGKISKRIQPIWDRWFEQEIRFNPSNGQMTYFIDGEKKGEFNVGKLNAKDNQIRLQILPWGWYVNHSIEMDYIQVSQ